MLVVRAVSRGVIVSVVAVVLYLVVAVLVPVVGALYESSLSGGGGMVGASVMLDLPLGVAALGFIAGFGWTFLERWARQPAGGGVKVGRTPPED